MGPKGWRGRCEKCRATRTFPPEPFYSKAWNSMAGSHEIKRKQTAGALQRRWDRIGD